MKTAILILAAVLMAGCSSLGPNDKQSGDALAAYTAFIQQQRAYDSIRIVGTPEKPATLTMTGTEITVSSALPPLSALGNDDTRARAFDALAGVLRMGIGAATAAYGFHEIADMPRGDTIIQQGPVATP